MQSRRAVIFANGQAADYRVIRSLIGGEDTLIAADGGEAHARKLGLLPQVLIGDLDSISPMEVKRLEGQGTQVIRYPQDKNETDLELALSYCLEQGFKKLLVVAPFGGRLDQTLGNINLMSRADFRGVDLRLDDGRDEAVLIRDRMQIHGKPGDILSLLPVCEPVEGVVTTGLKYPLKKETLYADKTRGISNQLTGFVVRIGLERGILLCIHTRKG